MVLKWATVSFGYVTVGDCLFLKKVGESHKGRRDPLLQTDWETQNYNRASLSFHTLLMRRNNRKVNSVRGSSACLSPVWLQALVLEFQCKKLIKLGKFSFRESVSLLLWCESWVERGSFKSQLAESCRDLLQLVVLRRLLPVFRCVSCDVILAVSFRSQLLNPQF